MRLVPRALVRLAFAIPLAVLFTVLFTVPGIASAATTKTYQVTGPVLAVTDTSITVQKGKETWEVARGKETKGPADVKVGDKVTIEYTMTATSIEGKGAAKGAAKSDAPAKPEAAPKK